MHCPPCSALLCQLAIQARLNIQTYHTVLKAVAEVGQQRIGQLRECIFFSLSLSLFLSKG